MTKIKLTKLWLVLVFVLIIGYLYINSSIITGKFYRNDIQSIIVDSSDWQKRTIEYYTKDGYQVDAVIGLGINCDIHVGDSISKQANTDSFCIYRKNKTGKYELNHRYCNK
ncbi:MAG: hypothetical protein ACOYOT_09325 [Bacteroidales bacterium]